MRAEILIPLFAGLIGALIGAFSSIATIWIQQRAESRRAKIRLASELAKEEHSFNFELAKLRGKAATLHPLSSYQHFHYEVLTALEKGSLTGDALVKIKQRNRTLINELEAYYHTNS